MIINAEKRKWIRLLELSDPMVSLGLMVTFVRWMCETVTINNCCRVCF